MSERVNIHGTAIAVGGRAVLIRGASGSGKSDLALRCLAVPGGPFAVVAPRLVADDRVIVEAGPDGVEVSAPEVLRGLLEVRGVGIVFVPSVDRARLVLVADIEDPVEIERFPSSVAPAEVCGKQVARISIAPFEASAPLKLLLALAGMSSDGQDG